MASLRLFCSFMTVMFGLVVAEEWTGNLCFKPKVHAKTDYVCEYKVMGRCWGWKPTTKQEIRYEHLCCKGWTHSGDRNCIIPVCSLPCLNGGRCVEPDQCECREGFSGPQCEDGQSNSLASLPDNTFGCSGKCKPGSPDEPLVPPIFLPDAASGVTARLSTGFGGTTASVPMTGADATTASSQSENTATTIPNPTSGGSTNGGTSSVTGTPLPTPVRVNPVAFTGTGNTPGVTTVAAGNTDTATAGSDVTVAMVTTASSGSNTAGQGMTTSIPSSTASSPGNTDGSVTSSGTTPGNAGTSLGNTAINAPGNTGSVTSSGTTPGNAGFSPGNTATNAPGNTANVPANTATNAPGNAGTSSGNVATNAPGNAGTSPGNTATNAPGNTATAPGNTGTQGATSGGNAGSVTSNTRVGVATTPSANNGGGGMVTTADGDLENRVQL